MRKPLVILSLLMTFVLNALAQDETRTRREPVPFYPPLTKPVIQEIPTTDGFAGTSVANGFKPPSATAESVRNTSVNLYTGTPEIQIPIYTLQEGRLSLPIYGAYSTSMIKPQTLAGWLGLGFELKGIPNISRIIRGFPDEGFTQDGVGRKGYYFWGYSVNGIDQNLDKEPDYLFLDTPSGSGKLMFDRYKKAHFFSDSDIKVEVTWTNDPNESGSNHLAKKFTSFIVTFPDGIKYTFNTANNESSAEVEVKHAQNNGIFPGGSGFSQFLKNNLMAHTWYCSKMESPYGEEINFVYDRITYTYYKSAEQEGLGLCPTGSGMDKKINKVFVRSSQIREITTSNLKVRFNTADRVCVMDYSVTPAEETCTTFGHRTDIDSWSSVPLNGNNGKRLNEIEISDNEISPVNKLTYSFEYDYFQGIESALPTGYIYNDIGTTHQKRLKLTGVNTPWGEKFSFFYDESGTMPTRLTYGIDHWGWANGAETNLSNPYGFVGSQFFAPEASTCGSNRAANFSFAKRGILTRIESSLGAKTSLTYEAHTLGSSFPAVGGVRVKSVLQEDPLLNTAIEKKYSYTLADNSSSGVAFLEPSYRVSYNNSGLIIFSHSNLFSSLLAESGRPEAAYSRVTEETQVLGNSPTSGKTITEFDFDPNFGTTRQLPWIACSSCPDNPVYFNLSHDYSQGAVKKQEIYNQSNQLISKTELQYTPNRGMKYDSTLAFRYYNSSYSFPGYSGNYWMSVSYYLPFKKFRVKSQTSTLYNPNGTGIPSVATTTIIYKDEMPLAYREKYKGKHNMPVKITTEDEEGNIIERNLLYTGDFGFDMEQVIVCPIDFPCPIDQLCPGPECQEIEYTVHVPPYSSDGRGIFESLARNILTTPVETRETINGQTVSSAYLALHSGNNSFITLPKSVYQLKTVPKSGFSEAFYNQPNLAIVKDVDYGTDPISEVLSYNAKGHPIDSKITKGVTSRVAYLNPTISNGSIHNLGKPDALTESLTFGKIYLGANRSIAPNLLEKKVEHNPSSGQVLVEKDKDNRVLRRYDYHLDLGAVSSVSWNELAFIKLCSGGNVTVGVSINGLTSSAIAQFSTDGGVTWQNANVGSNAFNYTRTAGTGTQEIRARASDAPSNVIITNRDISCDTPVAFNWGPYSVATLEVGPPRVCQYNVSVVGLTSGGTAQFSIDNGASWLNANVGTTQMQYALFANPSIQEFWARDSNNPTNVIYGTLNVCN